MSEIAELRKVFQDLVAPDLKAIQAELSSLKASVDKQFANVDKQFASVEAIAQARNATLLAKLETMEAIQNARHEAIMKALDIDKRLERIEAREAASQRVA
jgi:Lon protease-like protein